MDNREKSGGGGNSKLQAKETREKSSFKTSQNSLKPSKPDGLPFQKKGKTERREKNNCNPLSRCVGGGDRRGLRKESGDEKSLFHLRKKRRGTRIRGDNVSSKQNTTYWEMLGGNWRVLIEL